MTDTYEPGPDFTSDPTPNGLNFTRRLDHEPPPVTAQLGWRYHHIGIPSTVVRAGETHLEPFGLFVVGFSASPYGIEWMRFEKESPIHELIRTVPHVAFEVDDLDAALEGQHVIHPPGSPSEGVRSAMIVHNGAPVELISFRKRMKVLAVSGSLREGSSNTLVLRALVALAPADIEVSLQAPLDGLPFFNSEVEETGLPPSVQAWRSRIGGADAIVISSPEYAHGVSGVLKNALDWLVGGIEINGKPIAVLNARPQATIAHGALVETLRVMGARVVDQTAIPLTGRGLDRDGILADAELAGLLGSVLSTLRRSKDEREGDVGDPA